ncbi:hypothetical protein [Streptomyces sp. NPDC046860]|uniref:hypothetical protein n=1 Tax=Streptomyces sp. NPDC046860 TaxID=3154495 RepID=UPI0033C4B3A7
MFSEEKRHRDFKIAFDFGFVAVESVASALSLDTVVQTAMRVDPCACGRLTFGGADLTREHLARVAEQSPSGCRHIHDAVTWPSSAESCLPELSPFPERPPLRRRARQR